MNKQSSKFDQLINEALSAEEQDLPNPFADPGFVTQAFQMFRGPWAWVMWLLNAIAGLAFVGGLYSFWNVWQSTDTLVAVKWATAGLALFLVTVIGKNMMGTHLEANRVLREVKRVELQMALLRAGK